MEIYVYDKNKSNEKRCGLGLQCNVLVVNGDKNIHIAGCSRRSINSNGPTANIPLLWVIVNLSGPTPDLVVIKKYGPPAFGGGPPFMLRIQLRVLCATGATKPRAAFGSGLRTSCASAQARLVSLGAAYHYGVHAPHPAPRPSGPDGFLVSESDICPVHFHTFLQACY
jgi:hypothetical protein